MSTTSAPTRTSLKLRWLPLLAVLGPGLLAGLSDDDPAGITTYSVLGANYGYQLLWVLLLSTIALVVFHNLGARMGVVTGQGLIGLIRQRFGVRAAALGLTVLVVANIGTTCAEFAGIAAGFELFGISRYISVPRPRSSSRCWWCGEVFTVWSTFSCCWPQYLLPTSLQGFSHIPTGVRPRVGLWCPRCR